MCNTVFSQQSIKGSVKGRVKDVEKDYFLTSATVSLFSKDSTLVSFQITDAYGGFSFGNIPLSQPYYLEISNVGYSIAKRNFTVGAAGQQIDLGIIEMKTKDVTLDEVTIRVSPITMNGDTLEVNPAAFKLDSNAVLEDMLRKIPNVTVWNDGQITVNGREIKSLIVNGKPFFGGDFKVAIQNIPKNIIQTIQVYKKEENKANPLDSLLEMNVKLKNGKDFGYFGKFSGGLGTSGRFDAEGNLNIFSKNTQLSLVGAGNNTNRIPNDVKTLLNTSTFKGGANDLDYQTNFSLPGDNKTYSAGVNITHDFIELPKFDNKSSLSANYFYQRKFAEETSNSDILNSLSEALRNLQNNVSIRNRFTDRNQLSLDYNLAKNANIFSASGSFSHFRSTLEAQNHTNVVNSSGNPTSASDDFRINLSNSDNFRTNLNYSYNPDYYNSFGREGGFVPFDIQYFADLNKYSNQSKNKISFISYLDPSKNTVYDRLYNSNGNYGTHGLDFSLQQMEKLLFGKGRKFLSVSLVNRLKYENSTRNDEVKDLQNGQYVANNYLTNILETSTFSYVYGLRFSKNFTRRLSNRFEKNVLLSFSPNFGNVHFESSSEKAFQNISRNYHAFLPEANVTFFNHLFGRKKDDLSLSYLTVLNLPSIDQMTPLVDSTQVYYLRRGNARLDYEKIKQFNVSFSHENLKTKNAFTYRFEGGIGLSDNKIVDSTFISADNRQTVYSVNSDGYRSFNIMGELRKAIKFEPSDLKFQLSVRLVSENLPTYVNDNFLINKNLSNQIGLTAGYGFKDIITLELRESVNYYRSEQPFFDSKFTGKTFSHALNVNYNISKRTTLNSNITLNSNMSSGANRIDYTIWNAYLSQRFLKGNNGEVKLSALDLLHQNTNVINQFGANSFITTSRNVLQQYFLVSLSYYPRQFGKKSR